MSSTIRVAAAVRPGETVTRSVRLPWRTNMFGVSFVAPGSDPRGTDVEARTLTSGSWSSWFALETDGEDLPNGVERKHISKRVASDPVWVGTVDGAEVRVSVPRGAPPARDVRLHALNTLGNARPAGLITRAARAIGSFLTMRPAPAEAVTSKPTFISRKQWGTTESWRDSPPRYADEVRAVFVHHTDTRNSYTRSQSAGLIRGIYHYHTHSRDFADVAYNFFVDRYGQIFEGRAGGIEKPVIGAHTLGFNTRSTGIAMLGTYSSTSATAASISALSKLAAWKMDVHHIPPVGKVTMVSGGNERYPAGRTVTFNRISGHRDAKPTACPGARLYAKLPAIRAGADKLGHPKIYVPKTSTTVLRPDGNGVNDSLMFTGSFSRPVDWTIAINDTRAIVRQTFTGTGTKLSQRWKGGSSATGTYLPTGIYRWTLTAKDAAGRTARPASELVYLVTSHPDGTLLRDTARYTVSGTHRYDETDPTVFRSIFVALPSIPTGPAERGRYVAAPVGLVLRDGALLQSNADGSRWIWSAGTLRRFALDASADPPIDVFASLGYNAQAVIGVAPDYIAALPHGPSVEDTGMHPPGSVVRDSGGAMSVIGTGVRAPISLLARRTRYDWREVVAATDTDLALPLGPEILPRDGAVIAPSDSGAPWLITGGRKSRIFTWELFSAMGYTNAMLVAATSAELATLPTAPKYG